MARRFLITLPCVVRLVAMLGCIIFSSAQAGVILTPLDPVVVNGMHSLNSNQTAAVEFINQTSFTVDVFWKDFAGTSVFYNTLTAGQSYEQSTFITHPWVIKNHATSALVVGFLPVTPQPGDSRTPDIANINQFAPEPASFGLALVGLGMVMIGAGKRFRTLRSSR